MKKSGLLLVLAFILIPLIAASQESPPVKIGLLYPMSGPQAAVGRASYDFYPVAGRDDEGLLESEILAQVSQSFCGAFRRKGDPLADFHGRCLVIQAY